MVWSWFGWVVSRLGWVVFWVLSNTFVFDISNISSVSIGDVVGNNLGTAIRKIDTVFTVGGVSVTVFVSSKISFSVVIMDSISVFVYSWSFFVVWSLAINWSWGMVSWSMYYWFVDDWGVIWSWSWGMVGWGMYYWFVNWGWVINWGWFVNWSCVINWSRFVYWGCVVWGWLVNWNMSRSMNGSTILFSSIWIVYVLWSSMGLAGNGGVVSSMSLVGSNFDSWSVAVFDNLMTALVSQSDSQKSRYSEECLFK
jgi:hypothetical protein